ncbi:mitochondrial sodium/calcium exchanger protein isoform X2 [Gopherus evgoodei]|uniref:mitochondrial sodium/calcium exchanger protein isoform X2 n=1 Tax=Gopherus evgoodei TaxID=1825980 RepID=UPI0011CF4133|nr:mitochondrial sodium/calcium exchanger protein isoform X2 [Gopherus evgoodei]
MALGPVSWRASCILGVLWMLSCGAGASGADAGSRGVGSQMPPQLEIGSKSDGIRYAQHQGSPADCWEVRTQNSSKWCHFIWTTPDCQMDSGFLNYLNGVFCVFPSGLLPLVVTLYALWLLYLFLILGVTAEKFFCPNLSAISTNLRLAHNVAGVTFLAFGNGAPDVFSAVVAFSDPRTAGLAIGALFGAGVFVTTVVAGGIALLKPFTVASRPFLRDAIFYMVAVFLTFTMLYFRRITLAGALSYLGLYIFYVLTVVICTWIHKRQRGEGLSSAGSGQPDHASDPEDEDSLSSSVHREEYEEEYRPLLPSEEGTLQILTNSMNPLDRRKWRRKSCYWRFLKVFKMPVEFVMLLTVPVVDPDQEDHNWKRPLNCLHLITSPLVCILTLKSGAYGLYKIQGVFPVWGLGILIGAFLAAIVFCTTKNEEPPKYHCVFAFLGFLASALWINAVATEVVNVLRTLGVVFQLSNTVLGLTLLAWGNSIGAGAGWSSGLDSSWSTGAEPGVFLHNSAGSVLPAGPRVRSLPPPLLPGFPHGSFADGVQGDPTPCPLTASPPDAILSLSTSGENGGSGLMSLQGLDQPADGEGARGDGRTGQMQVSH